MIDACTWCRRGNIYADGTRCKHGDPPKDCRYHGKWIDLNLVARGRRAVIKCTHYGNAWVVLWVNPISDDKDHGSYTIEFGMLGVGRELYTIPPLRLQCPHYVYDRLVQEMYAGARPAQNRVPAPTTNVTKPGTELDPLADA